MPGKMAAEWVCVVSFAKKDKYLKFGCFFLTWNCWEGRYDSWRKVCVCFFVDMVIKQSETCFWWRSMSPCYPSIQKIWTRYCFFCHPFLPFQGHWIISIPNDLRPWRSSLLTSQTRCEDHLPCSFRMRRLRRTSRKATRKKRGKSSKIKYHQMPPVSGKIKLHANVAGKFFVDFPKIIVHWFGLVL